MALGWKKIPDRDDPRLTGHQTTYQASRGGWVKPVKPPKTPLPGAPKS
ncbi:hypothetical protein ACIP68_23025 [Streptomyces griseoviridis]